VKGTIKRKKHGMNLSGQRERYENKEKKANQKKR